MQIGSGICHVLVMGALLGGCAGVSSRQAEPPQAGQTALDGPGSEAMLASSQSELPRDLPKSRSGNPRVYEVFGKQYQVMDSAVGYREKGVASWYGSKFHGRKTSSGEVYNMYNMTAAHKSLPIPTFVTVRNLDTNHSITVKVNDRGPFHTGRVIDLSYAAAAELGLLEYGTAPVEVIAITRDIATDTQQVTISEPVPSGRDNGAHVIQVGAFSVVTNAESMRKRVNQAMQVPTAYIVSEQDNSLHRVRFGVAASTALDDVFAQLEYAGIENYSIISE